MKFFLLLLFLFGVEAFLVPKQEVLLTASHDAFPQELRRDVSEHLGKPHAMVPIFSGGGHPWDAVVLLYHSRLVLSNGFSVFFFFFSLHI